MSSVPPGKPVVRKGGKIGAPRLNGQAGSYAEKKGISMLSVREGALAYGA